MDSPRRSEAETLTSHRIDISEGKDYDPEKARPPLGRLESYHDDECYLPVTEDRLDRFNLLTNDTVRVFSIASLATCLSRCIVSFVPSFINVHGRTQVSKPIKPTAWLDGLRGVAAFLVVIHHHSGMWYLPLWHHTFAGAVGPWETFFQIPYVKLFYFAGPFYVAIFFVISGYSLAYKPLSFLRVGQTSSCLDSLSSSAFRRAFRLFLPPSAVTFGIMLTVHLGWRVPEDPSFLGQTFLENLSMWFYDTVAHFDVLRPMPLSMNDNARHPSAYNIHLWTIPVEFQGSMAVFMVLLASTKLSSIKRIILISALVLYAFFFNYLYHVTFIAGMLLAECDLIYTEALALHSRLTSTTTIVSRECCSFLLFFLSLTLAMSTHRLVQFAAITIVLAINYSHLLQSLFTTRFAQYLGRISFSLYMVHGTIMITLCSWLMPWIGGFIRSTADMDHEFVLTTILTSCVSFPFTICVADWVTRYIDEKAVSLAAKIWKKAATVDDK